jgi:hypothetical protein
MRYAMVLVVVLAGCAARKTSADEYREAHAARQRQITEANAAIPDAGADAEPAAPVDAAIPAAEMVCFARMGLERGGQPSRKCFDQLGQCEVELDREVAASRPGEAAFSGCKRK